MAQPNPNPILARMAGLTEAEPSAAPDRGAAPDLARALGDGMSRAGARMPALDLAVTARSCERMDTLDALATLPDLALALPLRGEGDAVAGALVLDGALVDALVEVQTLGRVDGAGRPARKPTRIDATLARPFATSILAEAAARLLAGSDAMTLPPVDASRHLVGAAQLRREIEAPMALAVSVEATLAGGARSTMLRLVLPNRPSVGLPAPAGAEDDPAPEPRTPPGEVLRAGLVRLEAVLPPLRVPLARLTTLKVGDTIPLPEGALSQLTLRGGRLGTGRPLPRMRGSQITGRLGQQAGLRAVKLTDGAAIAHELSDMAPAALGLAAAEAAPVADEPAAMPDLPDVPDLPDLPELDDLPDLPDL